MSSVPETPCVKCGVPKPRTAEFFEKAKSCKDGLARTCKVCHSATHKISRQINAECRARARQAAKYIDAFKLKGRSPMKPCSTCGLPKPATTEFFHKQLTGKYGVTASCIDCCHKSHKKWYEENRDAKQAQNRKWAEANPKRVVELSKAYYEKNKERILAEERMRWWGNREEQLLRGQRYYERNREDVLEKMRIARISEPERFAANSKKWRDANKDKIAEGQKVYRLNNPEKAKSWAEANPEKVREHRRNTKARRKQAPGTHTAQDVRLQFAAQRGKCYWCRVKLIKNGPGRFHVDHVFALAKGGTNNANNICCACPTCNTSKGAKTPWDFKGRLF